ncbi:protein LTO1 homolog isoform 4-T6 [Morphnus guianensis]
MGGGWCALAHWYPVRSWPLRLAVLSRHAERGGVAGAEPPSGCGGAMAAAPASSDMFDEIVMAEERFHGEGYQEGYAEGSHLGVVEGRRYGSLHGAKMGSEIGCYLGFALTWQCLLQKCTDEKNRNVFDPWQRTPWRKIGNKGTQRRPLVKMDFSKLNQIKQIHFY